MKPILYSYWRSSCSYRVRLVLNYLQQEYEYRPVHLVKNGGEQFLEEFSQMNPKQEVPYYIDQNVQLSESMAICLYLNDTFAEENKKVIPTDTKMKYISISLAEMINSGIQPIQNLKVLKFVKNEYGLDDAGKMAWGKHWIQKGLESFELKLTSLNLSRNFCLGESFSIVDAFLYPQVYNAIRFGVELEQFSNIHRIYQHGMSCDFVIKSIPENQIDAIN